MTDNDFKFEDIGKQLPYRTPEDFFEKMQQRLTEQIPAKRRRRLRWRLAVATAAAAAAVLAGGVLLRTGRSPGTSPAVTDLPYPEQMDRYVEGLSDEELAEWMEFSENDLFINLY